MEKLNNLHKIKALEELGRFLNAMANETQDFSTLIDDGLVEDFKKVIKTEHIHNGWFTEESIKSSLNGIAQWLNTETLSSWVNGYDFRKGSTKVGIIMAGNIPLVGFHDFLSVFLSGNIAVVKLSSNDKRLFPTLIKVLEIFYPDINEEVILQPHMKNIDAIIATGSDNSALYFEKYFGHLPNIIRRNRTSIAVLNGNESDEELNLLGNDIFTYFGLGCRNVSKLLVPKDYDLNNVFKNIFNHKEIVNHNKYGNNYDYHKAIYLMNQTEIFENGFLLTIASDELFAPVSVLYVQRYNDFKEVEEYLNENQEHVQVVVGHGFTPFGKAQNPELNDYADGVDTMKFLSNL